MEKKPYQDSRLAKFLDTRLLELKHKKTFDAVVTPAAKAQSAHEIVFYDFADMGIDVFEANDVDMAVASLRALGKR